MRTSVNIDSLIANEFAVEINGEALHGVFGVSGLTTYKLDDDGQRIKPAFTVSKMVQRDPSTPFNTWLRETMEARASDDRPRRDLAVIAIDDGVPTRRWTARGAYIKSVSYSDFDEASFEMVQELVEILYDDIEEAFLSQG